MNNKNVIINVRSTTPVRILESRTEGSDLYLVGEFTTFDVMNRNKRIYRKDNYKAVLEQIADKCASGGLLGELGHPSGRNATEMTQVSHVVTKLEIDEANNCVRGELKLLDTPNGRIARTLIESGVPMFVSSRASGYIGKGGVVTLTNLVTYDLVDEPGFANARLSVRDITESLCSECGTEDDTVAVFACDNTAASCPSCEEEGHDDIKALINNLTAEVRSLANRVASCESKYASRPVSVQAQEPVNVEAIVDSRIAEGLEEIRSLVYSIHENNIQAENDREFLESLQSNSNKARNRYMDYIVEECNKLHQYVDYVVNECNKHQKYTDYIAEQYNQEMGKVTEYLEYMSKSINEGQGSSDDKRITMIENYLEHIGLEYNKAEKAMNEKLNSFVEYTDYIAKTINENNAEVEMLQNYVDHEVVSVVEELVSKNKVIAEELRENYKKFGKLNESMTAMDTRVGMFTESVSEQMDAMRTVSNTSDMTDVKKLLESIKQRENLEVSKINQSAQNVREGMFLDQEEKRLLTFMHPSVKHIWESFDRATKMKIANDMSVSKCLAVQTQSLMLTRMINNYNCK